MTLRSLAGGRVFAEVTGSGPSLVIALHGWGRSRGDLASLAEQLATRMEVAAIDLPGFGASPEPPTAWGARDYASLVREVIDELNVESKPVVLFGHSFGGDVALSVAATTPQVVGLVLTGAPRLIRRPPSKPALPFRLLRALNRGRLVSDKRMEAARQRYGSADYLAARGVMREIVVRIMSESYEDELMALGCPTSFIWGELDTAAPPSMAREASQLVSTPHELVIAEGIGHDVHHERPELLVAEITKHGEAAR